MLKKIINTIKYSFIVSFLSFFLFNIAIAKRTQEEQQEELQVETSLDTQGDNPYKKQIEYFTYKNLSIAVTTYNPKDSIADFLFVHGLGGQSEHHQKYFEFLVKNKIRVISFDLPSHGKTITLDSTKDLSIPHIFEIDRWSIDKLSILTNVVKNNFHDSSKQLFIGSWSLGGAIVLNQFLKEDYQHFIKDVKGFIFIAPAISVPLCVGNYLCQITNKTLSHDLNLDFQFRPMSPLYVPSLGLNLLIKSLSLKKLKLKLPNDSTALFFTAGDDYYVKTKDITQFVYNQDKNKVHHIHCHNAYHSMDNELEIYGGSFVLNQTVAFIKSHQSLQVFGPKEDDDFCEVIKNEPT